MTVPALAGGGSIGHTADESLFQQTPHPDPLRAITALLAVPGISPDAYRMAVAAILHLPYGEMVTLDQFAHAAGISHHQARRYMAELVRARCAVRRRTIRRMGDELRDLHVYALAGAAR